ncbi:hypothetical protein LF41_248 [Lysobacter dokdonensis DS-58]|uniref:Uncharacterized protein n=1 Tax=Lysobacter dokdonensis DS-58 TaxID=1300345 RepID=A0A0A2WKU9_9GAMM|nr:hypothetical protein LF41_248 [Lysobacter dokdonensis DS-58]
MRHAGSDAGKAIPASSRICVPARQPIRASRKTSGNSGKFPNRCFHLIARSLELSSPLGRISRETGQ